MIAVTPPTMNYVEMVYVLTFHAHKMVSPVIDVSAIKAIRRVLPILNRHHAIRTLMNVRPVNIDVQERLPSNVSILVPAILVVNVPLAIEAMVTPVLQSICVW